MLFSAIRLNAQSAPVSSTTPIIGVLTVSSNPQYFKDAHGTPLILNGSQSWNTFQDFGTDGSPQVLDFNAFVRFLSRHGHNFTLLWAVEMAKFCNHPNTVSSPPAYSVTPLPWTRTGPGTATDGGLKFDLAQFDQGYFERLRQRAKHRHSHRSNPIGSTPISRSERTASRISSYSKMRCAMKRSSCIAPSISCLRTQWTCASNLSSNARKG